MLGIIACAVLFTSSTPFPGYWAAAPVLATVAVIVAGDSVAPFGPNAALSVRPMMFVGLISYSLYLVHWPLLLIPQAAVGFENPLPLWVTLLLGAASLPVAVLMYRYVEEPGRTGKWLAAFRPRRSLLAAGAASIAVSLLATGTLLYSNSRPLHLGEEAPVTSVSSPPSVTNYVPSNLRPSLRTVSDDQPVIYEDGCHLGFSDVEVGDCIYGDRALPRIVLFGDSHAAQWFPALIGFAEANGYSVENHTKSSCPSTSIDILRDGIPYTECAVWRQAVIDHINEEKPALVVLANYAAAQLEDAGDRHARTWGAALGKTLDAIGAPKVILADTPALRVPPSICLSANLQSANDCGEPRSTATRASVRAAEAETAAMHGVRYADLTDYFCTVDLCAPILGDILVYRDAHHITATYSAQLADVLGTQLESVLLDTW